MRIYERRSLPKPKKRAADFLHSINAEAILQIAMMCDAAAEEMELTLKSSSFAVTPALQSDMSHDMIMGFAELRIRFNDRNTVDVAQLRAAMDSFMDRVTALFVKRKACNIHCYTHAASWLHLGCSNCYYARGIKSVVCNGNVFLLSLVEALQWLQKETVVRIKHDFRSIGGPDSVSPQLLGTCFDRMIQWVELAKETLEAEWPSFEAVRAFSVFQLRPRLSVETIKKDLAKISQIFNEVDQLPVLLKNYLDCQYTAGQRRSLD
eukprot:s316_g5.t1